jgi:hypothetical protein
LCGYLRYSDLWAKVLGVLGNHAGQVKTRWKERVSGQRSYSSLGMWRWRAGECQLAREANLRKRARSTYAAALLSHQSWYMCFGQVKVEIITANLECSVSRPPIPQSAEGIAESEPSRS